MAFRTRLGFRVLEVGRRLGVLGSLVDGGRRLAAGRRPRIALPGFGSWRVLLFSRAVVCSRNPPTVYPPLVIRAVAAGLDFLVLLALDVVLVFGVAGAAALGVPGYGYFAGVLTAIVSPLPLTWLYFALQESGPRSATFGSRACHLRVMASAGGRFSFARASARHAGRYLSAGSFGLGLLLWFFTPRRQTLHDLVSGSVVVRDVPRDVIEVLDRASGASSVSASTPPPPVPVGTRAAVPSRSAL